MPVGLRNLLLLWSQSGRLILFERVDHAVVVLSAQSLSEFPNVALLTPHYYVSLTLSPEFKYDSSFQNRGVTLSYFQIQDSKLYSLL